MTEPHRHQSTDHNLSPWCCVNSPRTKWIYYFEYMLMYYRQNRCYQGEPSWRCSSLLFAIYLLCSEMNYTISLFKDIFCTKAASTSSRPASGKYSTHLTGSAKTRTRNGSSLKNLSIILKIGVFSFPRKTTRLFCDFYFPWRITVPFQLAEMLHNLKWLKIINTHNRNRF